jgi:hypothetical protein
MIYTIDERVILRGGSWNELLIHRIGVGMAQIDCRSFLITVKVEVQRIIIFEERAQMIWG